jgi:putative Mg2+ transporter-C (MgtC) family protein
LRVTCGKAGNDHRVISALFVTPPLEDISTQGWGQVACLAVALGLGVLIGLERELDGRPAGLRTQTVVALGSALFVLISKYGFLDVLGPNRSMVDPSRVASIVVQGIGFIGAGMIFVQRDNAVRGLTTAASVWLTAAVGSAAGAGLWLIAAVVTAMYLIAVRGLAPASNWLRNRQPIDPANGAND